MGLGLMELCARNLSAAIQETLNAQVVAQRTQEAARVVEGHLHVTNSVISKINEARLLLEVAQEEMNRKI